MEDANATNTEDYKDAEQNAFKGKLMVYIQALDQTGKGKVMLLADGIKSGELVIDVVSTRETDNM
jgi:hypothetical protein